MRFTIVCLLLLLLLPGDMLLGNDSTRLDKSTGSLPDLAQAEQDSVMLYLAGRYEEARTIAEWVLSQRETRLGPQHGDTAASHGNLGAIYFALGQFNEAERRFWKASNIIKSLLGTESKEYAGVVSNLGCLYYSMGRYDEAVQRFTQAIEIMKRVEANEADIATVLENLSVAYTSLGRLDEALKKSDQAIEIREHAGERYEYATSLNNRGTICEELRDYELAERLYRQALEIRKEELDGSNPALSESYRNLAGLYFCTDRPTAAIEALVSALEVEQENLILLLPSLSESEMVSYLGNTKLMSSMDMLLTILSHVTDENPEAAEVVYEWVLRRKALMLDTLCRLRSALVQHPEVKSARSDYEKAKKELIRFLSHRGAFEDQQEWNTHLTDLATKAVETERELHQALKPYVVESSDPVKVSELKERIPQGTALVEVVRFCYLDFMSSPLAMETLEERYLAFVLRNGHPVIAVDLGEATEIDRLISSLHNRVAADASLLSEDTTRESVDRVQAAERKCREICHKLGARLYTTLEKAIGDSACIWFAPDGSLHVLPMAALVDHNNRYLVTRYKFMYLSNTRDLLHPKETAASGSAVFADPDFALPPKVRAQQVAALRGSTTQIKEDNNRFLPGNMPQFSRLPHTLEEAEDVAELLSDCPGCAPVSKLTGDQALEDRLKSMGPVRALHIATHGWFYRPGPPTIGSIESDAMRNDEAMNPMLKSALILAGANTLGASSAIDDGRLYADEIALLDLHGTDLVVLSACVTGLGDITSGEGVFGLSRAFSFAGARNMVVSLFPVTDQGVPEVMKQFYARLRDGASKTDALHGAQTAVFEKRRAMRLSTHPYYWAAFILEGVPD